MNMEVLVPTTYRIKVTSEYYCWLSLSEEAGTWTARGSNLNPGMSFLTRNIFNSPEDFLGEFDKKWGGVENVEYVLKLWKSLIEQKVGEIGWKLSDQYSGLGGTIMILSEKNECITINPSGKKELHVLVDGHDVIVCGEVDAMLDKLVEIVKNFELANEQTRRILMGGGNLSINQSNSGQLFITTAGSGGQPAWAPYTAPNTAPNTITLMGGNSNSCKIVPGSP